MSNSFAHRILVVDDEPTIAQIIAKGLLKSNPAFQVETAIDGEEAVEKISGFDYTLVVTDYRMPRMNGLELANIIRLKSPHTKIVMMTAHGSDQLYQTSAKLRLDGILDKPVDLNVVKQTVQQAVAGAKMDSDAFRQEGQTPSRTIRENLTTLQLKTHARCVLLLSTSGSPIEMAGSTANLDIMNTSVLIAANFGAAAEVSRLLGNHEDFVSYHFGGPSYDIFCQTINKDCFLAVIYNSKRNSGIIRHYTQTTIKILRPLMDDYDFEGHDQQQFTAWLTEIDSPKLTGS